MKNNNDNLKEKEIKSEDPLKQDKLKNVSGGETQGVYRYRVNENICDGYKLSGHTCSLPICASKCPHFGAIGIGSWQVSSYECHHWAKIYPEKCMGCPDCGAMAACPHGAIYRY
jgi:Fe-S-cluster-containing hydrogenase component 2